MAERDKALKEIKEEIIGLNASPLYLERVSNKYFPVIGEGSYSAEIMFIGEAPGQNEAKTGRPFCGRAGKILDELLVSVGIERKDVYVTNIVKDRPPGNRDPYPDEISIYAPFLDRQIEIIRPKVIATLGRFSMSYVMNRFGLEWELGPISVLHGKVFSSSNFKFVPLYHPAAAIYNQHLLATLKEDFKVIKTLI
ncbi:MAG: uracil-DNA glycosylase [Candidatus Zambryskibacteria bacterium CG_4_9_14_3_um_filter_42_9]|uniref:Type-4 uracil-DNA glycosylase n=1 Tax=Candidatus Zambryskibacteria bacterium CG22_combo_CG10-13_8_21_14_all_42_17 TaxID=1975118 RepID=A0A2H0BDF1_9BACT|nr:MAG: uracil-DNA glycosylase [Candidatus Zambryskibacteria bacterium CG22_combo_CG10-13_8_21_14_all_42_17]PJA36646.1 MAG: uracil-DNA glycosylase [Candidatus Zambryskibacteria bacterium CG_4_9_14_3_um_filter_42_9]